ncbi:helix-turn-helix domain-containing protein [Streptomyces cadmiisoli]|uniref:helix-turn-helix domain-containing protein n=1 Tax=Streptomyces cadmiisoli TaxID=2184053 RepID=UPI00364CA0CE
MSPSEDEDRRRAERARQVGLFRYGLIQDLIDTKLTTRQRGKLARELAAKEHTDPFGRQVKVTRGTLDRWARHYRAGGFPALVPAQRQVTPRGVADQADGSPGLRPESPSLGALLRHTGPGPAVIARWPAAARTGRLRSGGDGP